MTKYSKVAILFHWLIAVLVIANFVLASMAEDLPREAQGALMSPHKAIGVSILLLSWAYARAQAKILIPVEYTAFVWAVLLGWWLFAEQVTVTTLCGTALIVLGCLVAMQQKPEHVDHVEPTAV